MAFLNFDNIHFAALTCAVPAYVQKINIGEHNAEKRYIKHFLKQIGIEQRHISITEQTCTDLGYAAAQKALDKAAWTVDSLDGIVFMSQTPDYNNATSNAHITHYRLGMRKDTFAFDITLACSSFPYGLSVCASFLQQEHIKRVLMISGDTQWNMYPSTEHIFNDETFLHGEASSAILLEKKPSSPMQIALHSDGSGYKHLIGAFEGSRNLRRKYPKSILPNGTIFEGHGRYMDGLEITNFATSIVVESIQEFLANQGKTNDDYDAFVLHQANMQVLKTITKRLDLSSKKVPITVDRYANTSGASVPLTIADAFADSNQEKISLLSSAFGTGLSWGIASFDILPSVIEPIFTTDDDIFEEGFVRPVK